MSAAIMLLAERAKLIRAALPTSEYLAYVRSVGLDVASLADPDPFDDCGGLAVTTIAANWEGGFDFVSPDEPKAVTAAVIEAYGADREAVADLVAWPLADPARVRPMFGRCDMLGAWNIASAAATVMGSPLLVHRTPLGWLQAGCRGVVLLDPKVAARRLLDAPGRIAGEDREHSREITSLIAGVFDLSRIVAPISSDMRKAA